MHEIAEETDIHMSTAHRLLWNLAEDGFVERDENGGWRLGLTFLELGSLVRGRLEIRDKAIADMQRLHELTGQTINLSTRRDDRVMYIEHVYAPETGVRLARQIGAMAPLHCTSGGKLFLCDCTPEEVSAYIARTDLKPRTSHSITSPEKLIWSSTASRNSAGPRIARSLSSASSASARRSATRTDASWRP